jgi:hypothetical protein
MNIYWKSNGYENLDLHSKLTESDYEIMVPSLIMQEVICCALLLALYYLTSEYLNQHNAYKDTILKPHVLLLGAFLVIKTLVNLIYILHYQGTLKQGSNMVPCIVFVNEISVVILNIGASLNLFKWLVILNRVYLHSGNRTVNIYERRENIHLVGYVFFVIIGSLI